MLLPIVIDKSDTELLQDQVSEQLRCLIVEGVLVPGTRVPTSRNLARRLGISRNTVTYAYERLIGEGYLQTRPASGTFVAEVLEDEGMPAATGSSPKDGGKGESRSPVFCGRSLLGLTAKPAYDFRLGMLDSSLFPVREWRRHILSLIDHHDGRIGSPPPVVGIPKLRRAIAQWLRESRGLSVADEDVLVTAGSQQAYNIAARLLVRAGDAVVVEAPCYVAAALVFEAVGARLLPVPVDEHGIRVDRLPDKAALAYLTPSHQHPVGGTLPLDRRTHLLAWAKKNGTYLFEDDIGCEFHYDGWQPPSLKSLDRDGLVLYCGSFSLTLGMGLRLGYVVVPPKLRIAAYRAKALLDVGCAWLEQAALANLMEAGIYDRHVARLRKLFQERRDRLVEVLRGQFGNAEVLGAEAGVHLGLCLPQGSPDAETIYRKGVEHGVGLYVPPPASFDTVADPRYSRRTVYLGYGMMPAEEIDLAVDHLVQVIKGPSDYASHSKHH